MQRGSHFYFVARTNHFNVSLSCYKFDSNRQPSWTLRLSHLKDIACNGIIINRHYWIFSTICCTIRYSPISSSSWITMWWSSVIRACWPCIRSTFEFYFSIYRANIRQSCSKISKFQKWYRFCNSCIKARQTIKNQVNDVLKVAKTLQVKNPSDRRQQ